MRHILNHCNQQNIDNQGVKDTYFLRYSLLELFGEEKVVKQLGCQCLFELCKVLSLFRLFQIEVNIVKTVTKAL